MISIVKFALRHGIRTFTILTMLILLSVYGLFHIPISLWPEITYPQIHITYSYEGMDPEFIATKYTPYIEGFIWSLTEVKSISSSTKEHSIDIDIVLKSNSDPERFIIKVFDVLKEAKLPDFFVGPFVHKKHSAEQYDMEFYIENCEKPLVDSLFLFLKAVGGIKKVEVIGEETAKTILRPRLFALHDLNILFSDIANYLGSHFKRNIFPLGKGDLLEIAVNSPNLSELQIRGIPLKDIFDIENHSQKSIFLCDGKKSILFRISFKSGENKVRISKEVHRILKSFESLNGKRITLTFDIGDEIKKAYIKLFLTFSFGLLFLLLILSIFERNILESTLTLLTAVLSAQVTLAIFLLVKVSINVVTLSGLVFGLGLLVDTAVVFVEEYHSNIQKMNKTKALFVTSSTTFSPLLASTLTSLIVFIPFFYASSDIRLRYKEFILALSIALVASLAIIYFIFPPFFFAKKHIKQEGHILGNVLIPYRALVKFFVANPVIPIVFYILIVGFSPFVYKRLNKGHILIFDKESLSSIIIYIYPASGSVDPLVLNEKIITPLNTEVNRFKNKLPPDYSLHTFVNITSEGAIMEIKASKKAVNYGVLRELRASLEGLLSNFGGLDIRMIGGGSEDFVISEGNVKPFMFTLPVYGYSYKKLRYIAEKIALELKKSEYFPITKANFYFGRSITSYVLDLGCGNTQLFMKLKDISKEAKLTDIGDGAIIKGKPIVDLYELESRITGIERKEAKKNIGRKNRYFEILVGFVYQGPPDSLKSILENFKKKNPLPPGFYYDIRTAMGDNDYTKSFIAALGFTVILLLLLIASVFNQIRASISVFFAIPFTLSGIFLIFKISNSAFDINAVLATLITIGIAVNDSIILVKKALVTRDVIEASVSRMRSIIYTSLTTIVTALPFLLLYHPEEMWHKFAYSVIGGISFSTSFALFILPAIVKMFKIS